MLHCVEVQDHGSGLPRRRNVEMVPATPKSSMAVPMDVRQESVPFEKLSEGLTSDRSPIEAGIEDAERRTV